MWQASPQRLITRSDCLSRRIAQAGRIRGDAGNICDTRTQKNGVVSVYARVENLIAADKNTIKRLGSSMRATDCFFISFERHAFDVQYLHLRFS